LEDFEKSFVKAAAEIPLETIRGNIDDFIKRLNLCDQAKGGHFE